MKQKISISRWNIGEASLRSTGDYDLAAYSTSCRIVKNFVPSETGKMWRRPGFIHQVSTTHESVRLIPFYLRNETFILVFFIEVGDPDTILKMDFYRIENKTLTYQDTHDVYTIKDADFEEDRPKSFDLNKLSYIQVENYLYMTHPNMEDPREIIWNWAGNVNDPPVDGFLVMNYSLNEENYYIDIVHDETNGWVKKPEPNFELGGGNSTTEEGEPPAAIPAGWTAYTGRIFAGANGGKLKTPPQTFKYLTCVEYSFERLVWAVGPNIHGSAAGDIAFAGMQYNGDIPPAGEPGAPTEEPPQILYSDPFLYAAASDLGYEEFYWLTGGQVLVGGANNGAWVLSNTQAGGLDTTNQLMYKATANGAYWVKGRAIGDSLLYFQRPGRLLMEFIFAEATQNYTALNLSEFSDHLFYDLAPIAMEIQRSPFNVAWILREDGSLVSFTYDRMRQIYAWARHDFTNEVNRVVDNGKVISICITSDGLYDTVVAYTERETSDGKVYAIEIMDEYTPNQIDGVFVDAAQKETLSNRIYIDSIEEGTGSGRIFHYNPAENYLLEDGSILLFNDVIRTDDGVQSVTSENYDYIYKEWYVIEYDSVGFTFKLQDKTGLIYNGIWEKDQAQNSYLDYGYALISTKHPLTPDKYSHLKGVFCEALLDGNPVSIYISSDTKFYSTETFIDNWEGDESILTKDNEIKKFWNKIIIGRPYESIFSPYMMKKQLNKGKLTKIELEVFRSLGGKIGTASTTLNNKIQYHKQMDLIYPADFEKYELYDGTIRPQIVGGYGDDPFFYIYVDTAVPFNITNIIYHLESN